MKHGSLFSGIGGFDLASEWMGWENVFHCEWNPFGQRILKYYWPNAKSYGDITTTDFSIHRGQIDIITGGFPCQPYSVAGKRKGKEDDRHLWPQMLRAIREVQPGWIVGENVPGLLNWNGGLVLDEIKADLEAEGFEIFPPLVLPACGLDAPHRRDRLWIIAYSSNARIKNLQGQTVSANTTKSTPNTRLLGSEKPEQQPMGIEQLCEGGFISNPEQQGRERSIRIETAEGFKQGSWNSWPTVEPTIRYGNDGLSSRLDGITFSKWRNESIKAGGNAVVPQIVYEIFKAIELCTW